VVPMARNTTTSDAVCARIGAALAVSLGLFSLCLQACVYRLANKERVLNAQPRTLFVSAIDDSSSHAGQAAKLMAALKRILTQDRAFILTDLKTARWGIEVHIISSGRSISRVEKCDQGNEILASGAVPCQRVALEGKLPDISAEEEIATLVVSARAIDLQNGAVLFQNQLNNLTTAPYPVVGDGSVRASLSAKQDLHVMRYLENSEAAIESLAQTAAQRIYEQLVAIPPSAPNL